MEGPLDFGSGERFYSLRAAFLSEHYGGTEAFYSEQVLPEFEKLYFIPSDTDVFLWFEFDLFCQVNMWVLVERLYSLEGERRLHWVRPHHEDPKGFGIMDRDALRMSFSNAEIITPSMVKEMKTALDVYGIAEKEEFLREVDKHQFSASIDVVMRAQARRLTDKSGKVELENRLRKMKDEHQEFGKVFKAFCEQEGIYGMGDLQVRKIYDRLC